MIARALEQAEDVRGRSRLPAQRAQRMDLREERGARALERLDRERARDVRGAGQPARAHEREREHRRHELRPVDEREPLLRRQLHRLEPDPRERVRTREALAVDPGLSLAHERQRQVRERREVAGGADGAAARHDRQHAALEEREEELHGLDARARVALRECVRTQEQRAADDLVGVRLADAARVRAQQAQLQFPGLLLGDGDRDEAPEAGVDAVGVLAAAVHGPLDQLPCGAHLLPRLVRQRGADSIDRHRPDVVDGQVVARKADRRRLRHGPSLVLARRPEAFKESPID